MSTLITLYLYEGLGNQLSWAIKGKSSYHCSMSSWQNSSWPTFLWHFMILFGKWSEKAAGSRRAWLIFSRLAPHLTKSQTNVNFLWPLITVLDRSGVDGLRVRKRKMFIYRNKKQEMTFECMDCVFLNQYISWYTFSRAFSQLIFHSLRITFHSFMSSLCLWNEQWI